MTYGFYTKASILFYLLAIYFGTAYEKKHYYLTELMKRVAPNSQPLLPKSAIYLINHPQMIHSAAIQLEDDGQMIKLHPDLSHTEAALFPEYPLGLSLKEIVLDLYLNTSSTSAWKSKGTAEICAGDNCHPVVIDEFGRFYGSLLNASLSTLLQNLSSSLDNMAPLYDFSYGSVSGHFSDFIHSGLVIDIPVNNFNPNSCNALLAISRKPFSNKHIPPMSSIDDDVNNMFTSTLNVSVTCSNVIPSNIIFDLVPSTLPHYHSLQKMRIYADLLNHKATYLRLTHQFQHFCSSKTTSLTCDYNQSDSSQLLEPIIYISIWMESDSFEETPTVVIIVSSSHNVAIKTKNPTILSPGLLQETSFKNTNEVHNILSSLNLTKSHKTVINPQEGFLDLYLDSNIITVDQTQACILLRKDIHVCNWKGFLRLFHVTGLEQKCSFIQIQGDVVTLDKDASPSGNATLMIQPTCKDNNTTSLYNLIIQLPLEYIHHQEVANNLSNFLFNSKNNDDALASKIFAIINVTQLRSIYYTLEAHSLHELLSPNREFTVNGIASLPYLNDDTAQFSLLGNHTLSPQQHITTPNGLEPVFQRICYTLKVSTAIKVLSLLTLLTPHDLPELSEGSQWCVKPQNLDVNQLQEEGDVHIKLPLITLSKCTNTHSLCSFLPLVLKSRPLPILNFEGFLHRDVVNLKANLHPDTSLFSFFNLSNCNILYSFGREHNSSIKMICDWHLSERGYTVSLQFLLYPQPSSLQQSFSSSLGPHKTNVTLAASVVHYLNIPSSSSSYTVQLPSGLPDLFIKNFRANFYMKSGLDKVKFMATCAFSNSEAFNTSPNSFNAYGSIDLKNSSNSRLDVTLPPYSLHDLAKLLGFGECPGLESMSIDTLKEWRFTMYGFPDYHHYHRHLSFPISVNGYTMLGGVLFNSTLEIMHSGQKSRLALKGVKPVIITLNGGSGGRGIKHMKLSSYYTNDDISAAAGPLILVNMECACETSCYSEDTIGNVVATIDYLGLKGSIKLNISSFGPWKGVVISPTFLGQSLKVSSLISLYSLEGGPVEIYGSVLGIEDKVAANVQLHILKTAKAIIHHADYFRHQLDTILDVLHRIRARKQNLKMKLETIKEKLDQEILANIIYETSINLTCKEEECIRICVGCPSTHGCAMKDILGSCVTLPSWDSSCRCGRDPLCVMYNDACDEIARIAKRNLRSFEKKQNNMQFLYDTTLTQLEIVLRDEAKAELLYSSALRIASKFMHTDSVRINAARAVLRDARITTWLKIIQVNFSLNSNTTFHRKESNSSSDDHGSSSSVLYDDMLCIYVSVSYIDRSNTTHTHTSPYCPSTNGSLVTHLATVLKGILFPYNFEDIDTKNFNNNGLSVDTPGKATANVFAAPSGIDRPTGDVAPFIRDIATKSFGTSPSSYFPRRSTILNKRHIRNNNLMAMKPFGGHHRTTRILGLQDVSTPLQILQVRNKRSHDELLNNADSTNLGITGKAPSVVLSRSSRNNSSSQVSIVQKQTNRTGDELEYDEGQWMLPSTLKGRCRVLFNVVDILNDLLQTINKMGKEYYKMKNMLSQQQKSILLNKDSYMERLLDAGSQLRLADNDPNSTYSRIVTSFQTGIARYVEDLEKTLDSVDKQVIEDWKGSMSARIKSMGGKGLARFLKNLQEVIEILELQEAFGGGLRTLKQKKGAKIGRRRAGEGHRNYESPVEVMSKVKVVLLEENQPVSLVFKKLQYSYESAKELKQVSTNYCI